MKALWTVLLVAAVACSPTLQPPGAPGSAARGGPLEIPPGVQSLQSAFIAAAERVSSSVVAIRVEGPQQRPDQPQGVLPGAPQQPGQMQHGMGSGVVIRADGYILTNRHVIANASRVEVVFQDGRRLPGRAVGFDGATDLAVIKVAASGLRAVPLADSNGVKPGQWVLAIGSPFGLDYTVTAGVVSATGRGGMGMNEIEDYLQTDASINPGNSGGPLVNLRGEVVGINTMIVGSGTGIGFAIPSSLARNVADQLIATGGVHRAFIGVGFQDLTPEIAEHFAMQGRGGALVSGVAPGGPADRAGIRPGDVIVSVGGAPIVQSRALLRSVLATEIGGKLVLAVVRDGKDLTLTVVTIERPSDAQARRAIAPSDTGHGPRSLGLHMQPLTPEIGRQLGYSGSQGAVVTEVDSGSAAERVGLARADLIVEADRSPVNSPADVDAALADGAALLRIARRGGSLYVMLSSSE